MNQVPERGRERERKKKKSGRKGDPFFSTAFSPPSSSKPLRLVFLQLVIWSLCFIFLSLVGMNANFVPLLITGSPMRSAITHLGKIFHVSLTWRLNSRFPWPDIALLSKHLWNISAMFTMYDNSQIQVHIPTHTYPPTHTFWTWNMHVYLSSCACQYAKHPKTAVLCRIHIQHWCNVFLSPSDERKDKRERNRPGQK